MSIEDANNWRARRIKSIKLDTSDRRKHPVTTTQGEGESDPARLDAMYASRAAERDATNKRREASEAARRGAARDARADVAHALARPATEAERAKAARAAARNEEILSRTRGGRRILDRNKQQQQAEERRAKRKAKNQRQAQKRGSRSPVDPEARMNEKLQQLKDKFN